MVFLLSYLSRRFFVSRDVASDRVEWQCGAAGYCKFLDYESWGLGAVQMSREEERAMCKSKKKRKEARGKT